MEGRDRADKPAALLHFLRRIYFNLALQAGFVQNTSPLSSCFPERAKQLNVGRKWKPCGVSPTHRLHPMTKSSSVLNDICAEQSPCSASSGRERTICIHPPCILSILRASWKEQRRQSAWKVLEQRFASAPGFGKNFE